MDIEKFVEKAVEKFGEDITIVLYPDFSGHIETSYRYKEDSIDLFCWNTKLEMNAFIWNSCDIK